MKRKHALLISLAIAAALVAGVFAAMRTTELGAASASSSELSDAQIVARDRELDRIEKRLRAHARKRPPRLPGLRGPSEAGSTTQAPPAALAVSVPPPTPAGRPHHDDDELEDREEDRQEELEDRRDEAEDAAEDRADELEDAREDAREDAEDDD